MMRKRDGILLRWISFPKVTKIFQFTLSEKQKGRSIVVHIHGKEGRRMWVYELQIEKRSNAVRNS